MNPRKQLPAMAVAVLGVLLLAGCDVIFTVPLAASLQRDPSDMSLEWRTNYARDALSSGDRDAQEEAYKAIAEDAASSNDGDLQLLAGQLALELSGLTDVMTDLLAEDIDFSAGMTPENEAELNALIAELNTTYLSAAADFYDLAATNGGNLDATDYLMGALTMLAEVAIVDHGGDVGAVDAGEVTDAITMLDGYLSTADPGAPSYDLVGDLRDFLAGL